MKLFWMIVSAVCIVVAAFLMWHGDVPSAFVVAVVGIVAWFLNYRIQMKEVTAAADREYEERNKEDSDEV